MSQWAPNKIQAELKAFEAEVGPHCDSYLSINRYGSGKSINLHVYAMGITSGLSFGVDADDWDEVFVAGRDKLAEVRDRIDGEKIEGMALAIIAITCRKGECCDADLRGAKFTDDEVKHYGPRACEKANVMAGSGPFSITIGAKANAA